jgi:hypothetical protein
MKERAEYLANGVDHHRPQVNGDPSRKCRLVATGVLAVQLGLYDCGCRRLYAASGTIPAACVLRASTAVIEHKLYWSSFVDENEALYLTAVLNSETARSRIAALQSRGQWGARDFDKVLFTLPVPRFDNAASLHTDLAAAARDAEATAAAVVLSGNVKFQRARKLVRDSLAEAGIAPRMEALVARLLGAAPE